MGTVQYSRSKEHQLRKWQPRNSWIQFPDFQAWWVKPSTRYQLLRRCTRQWHPDLARARKSAPTGVDKTTTHSKTETLFFDVPSAKRRRVPTGRIALGNESSHQYFLKNWENVPHWGCPSSTSSILVRVCGRHQDGCKENLLGPMWNILRKGIVLEDPNLC